MAQCIDFIPSERVRVFISSAQSNENGFAWSDVRRHIKESLSHCIYLNSFIIEDEGSVTPSLQFFQRQVERADVVVLLVKGEVRKGTATEYSLTRKLKKPLLVYFIDDENPNLEVINLRKELQNDDICTYHPVPSFDGIEITVLKDLMNDLIRAFQDKYYTSRLEVVDPVSTEIHENGELLSSGIPSRTVINKFSSCYGDFFDLLDLSIFKKEISKTEHHDFGCHLLSWLVNGKWEVEDEEILDFISKCSDVYNSVSWLQKRWDAIRFYIKGDLEKSLEAEDQALNSAREAKESDWIINNILIDCRNITIAIDNQKNNIIRNNRYQNELNLMKVMVCLPVLDRCLSNIYEKIEKDEFREETATPNMQLFGSGLPEVITDLANYLFTAAIYGSSTHLLIARDVLINILSRYSKIHDESSLAFSAIKQYVLAGNYSDFKLYLDSTWDRVYSSITSQADDIWKLTDFAFVTNRDSMKISVFISLGMYLSDSVFSDASDYILHYSSRVSRRNSELYMEAILLNLRRMNAESIIQTIIPIIAEKRFQLGRKLSRILLYIDLDKVSTQTLQDLASVMKEQLPYIVEMNGDPQMIAPLMERDRTIFGDLEKIEKNGLVGVEETLYKINRGLEDWYPLLQTEIETARTQFQQNNQKGVYHGFSHDPYDMISTVVRKNKGKSDIDSLILREFIPLSIDVLNSEAAVPTKESCVACLCEILSSFSERGIDLPSSIKQALQMVDIEKGTDFSSSSSRKKLEIRVLMAQIITGIYEEKSILRWCIEYGSLTVHEKIAIVDCLEKYIYHKKSDLGTIDSLLVSIVLQCNSEPRHEIRRIAVRCLAYLVSSQYHDISIVELNKVAFDSSEEVRNTLLNICRMNLLPQENAYDLISLLRNDANYIIRQEANAYSVPYLENQ